VRALTSRVSAVDSLRAGAVGVANTMVISVLERRSEIGLRRALGATRGHIRIQFLAEAILLALSGGLAATVLIGAAAGLAPALRAARMSPTEALWSI
jgi:putative ABC transport system permease protein